MGPLGERARLGRRRRAGAGLGPCMSGGREREEESETGRWEGWQGVDVAEGGGWGPLGDGGEEAASGPGRNASGPGRNPSAACGPLRPGFGQWGGEGCSCGQEFGTGWRLKCSLRVHLWDCPVPGAQPRPLCGRSSLDSACREGDRWDRVPGGGWPKWASRDVTQCVWVS